MTHAVPEPVLVLLFASRRRMPPLSPTSPGPVFKASEVFVLILVLWRSPRRVAEVGKLLVDVDRAVSAVSAAGAKVAEAVAAEAVEGRVGVVRAGTGGGAGGGGGGAIAAGAASDGAFRYCWH